MLECLWVALGGAVGSVCRYAVGKIPITETTGFPVKTWLINVAGSFLIGLIAAAAGKKADLNPDLLLFLKVGICGGFTTFSTFALETTDLLRSGKFCMAAAYVAFSAVCSVAAVFLAQQLVR